MDPKYCLTSNNISVVGFSLSDKSLGDTSDIISDSSGVGTANSDTTTSSLALPGATVVCLENYDSAIAGHLRISQGDIIEGKADSFLTKPIYFQVFKIQLGCKLISIIDAVLTNF